MMFRSVASEVHTCAYLQRTVFLVENLPGDVLDCRMALRTFGAVRHSSCSVLPVTHCVEDLALRRG